MVVFTPVNEENQRELTRRKTQNVPLSDYYRRGGTVGICGFGNVYRKPYAGRNAYFCRTFRRGTGFISCLKCEY